jgi:hypothetical protein
LNEVLVYEETDLEDYPFSVYQSFHFQDKIWCMTDLLKPGNKLMDKLLAQIDFAIGADVKNGWEIVVPWLAEGYSIETAIKKVKAGEPLPVVRPGTLHSIPQKGANPQWMELLGILDSMSDRYIGGDLMSGASHGKQRESTQTVQMRLSRQEAIAFLFINNLRRWKRDLFRKCLWYLKKYDTAKDIQKIHGSALTPEMLQLLQQKEIYSPSETQKGMGYVTVNDPGNELTILSDAEVDIFIVEEDSSETHKDAKYNKMIANEQYNPELKMSKTWLKLKLENLGISYEDRMKVSTEIEEARQQAQQIEQQEKEQDRNLEKAKVLISNKHADNQMVNNAERK